MSSVHQLPLPFPPFGKVCSRCHHAFPLEQFGALRSAKDGRHSWCKPCMAASKREERQRRPDHVRALARARYPRYQARMQVYMRAYYAAHAEELRAYQQQRRQTLPDVYRGRDKAKRLRYYDAYKARDRAYYAAHRKELLAYGATYRTANRAHLIRGQQLRYERLKSQIREAQRQYNATHPEVLAARNARRRFRENANGGNFTPAEWKALCAHYGNRCLACGTDDVRLTVDHVIPVAKGGGNSIANLQPLCMPCNLHKKDKHIDYR